ncbi:MAG: hypothetical protein ACPLX7_01885 [Candidatus Kapaibacteriota bacterium]
MKSSLRILFISIFVIACSKNTGNPLPSGNNPPIIDSVKVVFDIISIVPSADITCYARDPDGDSLFYKWSASAGEFSGKGKAVKYIIPPCCDSITNKITIDVFDQWNAKTSYSFNIRAPKK